MSFDATISAVNLTSDITIYFVKHSSTNRLVTTVQLTPDIPETSHSFSYASQMDIAIAKSVAPNLENMTLYDAFNVADTITITPTIFDNTESLRSVLPSEELWYFDNENITQTAYTSGDNVPWTFNFSGGTPEPTKYKVTSTLENCTLTPTDTEIAEGTETTFTVTANSGYVFNAVPTINGTEMTKTSDTVYTSTITVNSDVSIVAHADADIITYPVTYDLNHATIKPNDATFKEGDNVTFIATADDGYEFSNSNYVTINNTPFTISSDKKTATAVITVTTAISIVAHALIIQSHKITITGTLTHCTCNYNTGDDLISGKAVTFTADDGYYFNSLTPKYTVKRSSSSTYETITGSLSGVGEQTLIDGSQVTLYVRNNSNINITDDITATESPIEILQGVNVYELTEQNLKDVMNVRFTVRNTETGTQAEEKEPIDFGKWITNLYYMPFSTDNIINAKRSYIILGTKNTELVAKTLLSQFDIDLGTITVPKLNSSYIQENRDIKLYLPFVSETPTIGVEYSGKTLHITYHIDLIDETITIIVTDNENPVIYNKVNFGRNLPFFSTENGNTNLNYSNDGINNTIYTAFIIVTDNNVSLISNAPTDTFIKVSHIETMQTSATQEEQEMIINLLNEGVYIK